MKNRISLSAALFSILAVAACLGVYSKNSAEAATEPQEPQKSAAVSQQSAVSIKTQQTSGEAVNQYDPSYAWLAWQLFPRAMAPAGNGSLTFETWTELGSRLQCVR